MPNRFAHLRAEIVALASRLEEPARLPRVPGLDLAHVYEKQEWAWNALQKTVAGARQRQATDPPRTPGRTGRRRASITYAQAVHEWRTQREKLDGANPSRTEFCQYLVSQGYSVSTRTLRRRVQEWEKAGHKWPPPEETD
jgi:hypothetical protein